MAEERSGLFSYREFSYRRNTLRVAPDAFVTINDAYTEAVVSPKSSGGVQQADLRGGITSINVQCAVSPPGASRATIEVVAPQYKGLHQDYYVTMPNGTKVPVFTPMMEIKIYMKARFTEQDYGYVPQYYPVFWGMITGVQENYSGGVFTFSITCEDLLCWWRFQKITLQPGLLEPYFGGPTMTFPSVFNNMSPWEIIMALFWDSFFVVPPKDPSGTPALFNFLYPQFSNFMQQPDITNVKATWGAFAKGAINYWNKRFGFGAATASAQDFPASVSSIPLQMFGLRGQLEASVIATNFLKQKSTNRRPRFDLDYGMFSQVQPYGSFDLFGDGAESNIVTKLEIATSICEKVNMEFFVDTNGFFVFKPPFYNLDVATGNVPYYKIGPEDIINYNANFDSNSIINYLTVTGPIWQEFPQNQAIGIHADFESMKQFGIRSEQITVPYGINANQLKMIAVAEMARRNGQAYTGSVSIPLRPEIRLGYPVYIEHLDTFYYVTGVSHSVTFGTSATTDLSLQYRRQRIFEDGYSGLLNSNVGDVLDQCVYRKDSTENVNLRADQAKMVNSEVQTDLDKDQVREDNHLSSGPGDLGYWKLDKAQLLTVGQTVRYAGTPNMILSNELVMITDDTVPYTDKNGYKHIGGFPYGANLVLASGTGPMLDSTDVGQSQDIVVHTQVHANPSSENVPEQQTSPDPQDPNITSASVIAMKTAQEIYGIDKKTWDSVMEKARASYDSQEINPQRTPEFYLDKFKKYGLAQADATDVSVRKQLGSAPPAISNPDTLKKDNQALANSIFIGSQQP